MGTGEKDQVFANESVAWSVRKGGAYMPTPIVIGDYLYRLQDRGGFACFKQENGELIYDQKDHEKRLKEIFPWLKEKGESNDPEESKRIIIKEIKLRYPKIYREVWELLREEK